MPGRKIDLVISRHNDSLRRRTRRFLEVQIVIQRRKRCWYVATDYSYLTRFVLLGPGQILARQGDEIRLFFRHQWCAVLCTESSYLLIVPSVALRAIFHIVRANVGEYLRQDKILTRYDLSEITRKEKPLGTRAASNTEDLGSDYCIFAKAP